MKRKIAVLVSFILAAVMICSSCTAPKQNNWKLKIDGVDTEITCPLKIDGRGVDFELFRYYYLALKEQVEYEDSTVDFKDKEAQASLMNLALGQVKYVMAVEDTAKKYGFTLSDEDVAEIDEKMKSVFDKVGGADAYREELKKGNLTQELYERLLTSNALYTAMSEELVGIEGDGRKITVTFDEAVKAYDKLNYRLAAIPFMINLYDSEGNQVDEKTAEKRQKEALSEAEKTYKKLASTDFLTLMKEHYEKEEDINLQQYYPIDNLALMVGDEIKELKVGEYSKPMLANSAYFIFYRLEPDKEYLLNNAKQNVILACSEEKLGEILDDYINSYKVEKGEDFAKITPETLV